MKRLTTKYPQMIMMGNSTISKRIRTVRISATRNGILFV